MTNADDAYEEDYNEYDEFDDDDERGLSGFSVLVIGLVMIGAFISVVWIAYQQGLKRNPNNIGVDTPYVAAEPEPIKIETADNSQPVEDREVYDVFDGDNETPSTVLAEGPEEPVDRAADDPIAAIAADASNQRPESLAEEDAGGLGDASAADEPEPVAATAPTAASVTPANTPPSAEDALSGTHVVQVGAFRSNEEAEAQWARMQSRLGAYVDGKSPDIERADLDDRGVYYRLRIGPFSSPDDAKEYCTGLKERGQDCLIKSI